MIETAILTIRGERFLFKSFEPSPAAFIGAADPARGDAPPHSGVPARSFPFGDEGHRGQHRVDFAPFHDRPNAPADAGRAKGKNSEISL